jgi:hypothetical protein
MALILVFAVKRKMRYFDILSQYGLGASGKFAG